MKSVQKRVPSSVWFAMQWAAGSLSSSHLRSQTCQCNLQHIEDAFSWAASAAQSSRLQSYRLPITNVPGIYLITYEINVYKTELNRLNAQSNRWKLNGCRQISPFREHCSVNGVRYRRSLIDQCNRWSTANNELEAIRWLDSSGWLVSLKRRSFNGSSIGELNKRTQQANSVNLLALLEELRERAQWKWLRTEDCLCGGVRLARIQRKNGINTGNRIRPISSWKLKQI